MPRSSKNAPGPRASGLRWIAPLKPSAGRITLPATPGNVRRALAKANGDAHLLAYKVDRNPEHIFEAVNEYLNLRVLLPDWMQRNLEHAIAERRKKPSGNPKRTTLRDVYVLGAVAHRYGGKIPERVDGAFLASLAEAHGESVATLKMMLSRYRKQIKDPTYERARAFRKS